MARWGKPTARAANYRGPVYVLRRHQHHHGVLLNPCAEQVSACCETPKIGSRFITEGGCRKVAFIRLAIYNLPVSSSCVFCNIVSGTETASVVYDDSWTLAFIDIRQLHPGHTVVIPKHHIADVRELDETSGAALMATIVRVARAVDETFKPDGMNIWHSVGEAGGQEIFHLHFHVLPRETEDGMLRFYPRSPNYPNRSALDRQAASLRAWFSAS